MPLRSDGNLSRRRSRQRLRLAGIPVDQIELSPERVGEKLLGQGPVEIGAVPLREDSLQLPDRLELLPAEEAAGGIDGLVALLFAPHSGAETRRKLARGARRMRRAAEGAADDVSEKVRDTFDAARERVADGIDSTRETITAKRGQVERAVHAGREAAHQARHDIEVRLAETKAAYQAGGRSARESKTRDA